MPSMTYHMNMTFPGKHKEPLYQELCQCTDAWSNSEICYSGKKKNKLLHFPPSANIITFMYRRKAHSLLFIFSFPHKLLNADNCYLILSSFMYIYIYLKKIQFSAGMGKGAELFFVSRVMQLYGGHSPLLLWCSTCCHFSSAWEIHVKPEEKY